MDGKRFSSSGFRFFSFWGGFSNFAYFSGALFFVSFREATFPTKNFTHDPRVPFCPNQRHGVVRGEVSRSSMDVTVENHSYVAFDVCLGMFCWEVGINGNGLLRSLTKATFK